MNNLETIKSLNNQLRKAAKAYYVDGIEIMTNFEYDKLYDELVELEKTTGIILSDSVTQMVGYDVVSNLEKFTHPKKMLSLDKTKDREALKDWLGDKEGVLSFKADGLTSVIYYQNGKLEKIVSRGNGVIGEILTHTGKFMSGIPTQIPFTGELIVRGEAVIQYSEFEKINAEIDDVNSKYKNPRNLVSGTIRQLDATVMKDRKVDFFAFTLVQAEGRKMVSYKENLDWLKDLGFQVIRNTLVKSDNLFEKIDELTNESKTGDVPADGLVLFYDDIKYGESLGETSKFPRNGMAFKWADEVQDTILREIEWSASRTGLLNPVAIFDPVELEGTTVSRASVHNVSIIEDLKLNVGDKVSIFKANMIIPQIAENKTKSLNNISDIIPDKCPVCGGKTTIVQDKDTKVLKCTNNDCAAKHVGKFEHCVKRDALNIVGLSTSTIEKLISIGAIKKLKDLYYIDKFKDEIIDIEGLGPKSYNNLIKSIEASREIEPNRILYALGIDEIGRSASKDIMNHVGNDFEKLFTLSLNDFTEIDGIGFVMADNIFSYLEKNKEEIKEFLKEFNFKQVNSNTGTSLTGKTFVITGSVNHYKNRDELKGVIENLGGKVTGSVTSKTNYLINNDSTSNSSKNKKAKELGVAIITEEEFMKML